MKTQIHTGYYEFTHSKRPSGRGSWAFCPRNKWNQPDYLKHTLFVAGCKAYSEAKREAVAHFSKLNIAEAVVCS